MTGDVAADDRATPGAHSNSSPEDDHVGRGGGGGPAGTRATGRTAISTRRTGRMREAMASLERGRATSPTSSAARSSLGDIRIAQGRLDDAMRDLRAGLAARRGVRADHRFAGTADMHVGHERRVPRAQRSRGGPQHLDLSRELGDENGFPQNPLPVARGSGSDPPGGGRPRRRGRHCSMRPSASTSATSPRTCARSPPCGRGSGSRRAARRDASRWARERGLSATDELSYLHEFEHVTLARSLLAAGDEDRCRHARSARRSTCSERLLAAAEEGGRTGSVIDALVVLALARHAGNDPAGALASLAGPLALAEPERYVRVFLDEGPPMTALLKLAARQRDASPYTRTLLAAAVPTESAGPVRQPLIEPLSERELDVLRLLASDLGGPDIARELAVSLNTRPDAHPERLREARREQPPGGGPAGGGPRPPLSIAGRPRRIISRSSHLLMRAHHFRLHLRSSDADRCRRSDVPTREERDDRPHRERRSP